MKHYYIFKLIKQMACFDTLDKNRKDFHYLGEFESEDEAHKHLEVICGNICRTTDELALQLNEEMPSYETYYNDASVKPPIEKRNLMLWLMVQVLEMHTQLELQFRQKHTD